MERRRLGTRTEAGLGLRANICLITSETFEAGKSGNPNDCLPCEDATSVDLDKDWHAIHFLLTGDTSLTFLQTGVQIAELEGHCELRSPQDVAALHARLSKTSASELMSTFDSMKFDALGIYPRRWAIRRDLFAPPDASRGSDKWLKAHIEGLLIEFIALVERAAEKGLGISVAIL
jgi:hypothetical protein